MNAPARFGRSHRNAMIGKVHVAKKELCLDDDTYRGVIFRMTGRTSAGDCTDAELDILLAEFRRLGWQAAPRKAPSKIADHMPAKKARALWISLGHLGAIDNPSEKALEAFGARQLGCTTLQWANQGDMFKLIEALKAIGLRHGWDATGSDLAVIKQRLLDAILVKLKAKGYAAEHWTVGEAARQIAGNASWKHLRFWDLGDLDAAAGAFGRLLRDGERGNL